jgi:hypothetical protein
MEPEIIEYKGKRLRFVRTPKGDAKLYSEDIFGILGTSYPEDLVSAEYVIIEPTPAAIYARQSGNDDFADWIDEHFRNNNFVDASTVDHNKQD